MDGAVGSKTRWSKAHGNPSLLKHYRIVPDPRMIGNRGYGIATSMTVDLALSIPEVFTAVVE